MQYRVQPERGDIVNGWAGAFCLQLWIPGTARGGSLVIDRGLAGGSISAARTYDRRLRTDHPVERVLYLPRHGAGPRGTARGVRRFVSPDLPPGRDRAAWGCPVLHIEGTT